MTKPWSHGTCQGLLSGLLLGGTLSLQDAPALAQVSPAEEPASTPEALHTEVEPDEESEDTVLDALDNVVEEPEEELTVTGRVLDRPIFSPFRQEGTLRDATRPAYVITQEEIKAQGARNVREALRFLPGILGAGTVGTEVNALSGQFMRGANTGQVLILLDGRPINNLGSGGFDLSEITTDIVQQVEVLPGGGSTLYGSDALGGIINIITTRPQERFSGSLGVTGGNLGYNEQRVSLGGQVGAVSGLLNYTRIQAENDYRFSIPEADFKGRRRNNDTLFNNLRGRVDIDVNPRAKLSLNVLYLPKRQGVPGGVPIPEPIFGQGFFNALTDNNRKFTDQVLADLNFTQQLDAENRSVLTARVYADWLNTRFENRTTAAETLSVGAGGQVIKALTPRLPQQFETQQRSVGVQVQHAWQLANNQTLTYGADYRNTRARNVTTNLLTDAERENYANTISQGALFAQYSLDITPNLRTTVGLRQDFSSLAKGGAFSPSVGLKWVLGDTTLRANYIRNFRTPPLNALFSANPTNIGNPDLKPETGNSFDVGIDQKIGDFALLRLTAFQNTISNVVTFQRIAPPVDGISGTWVNLGQVRTRGLEASLNLRFARNLYGFVNYTLNDPRIRKSANPNEVGQELRFVGADKLGAGISYENAQGWYAGILVNAIVGSYPTNNLNTEFLPGYTTVDLRLQAPILPRLTLNLALDNLLNKRYQLFPGFPDAGRTIRAGVDWQF